ncbi:methyltransferase [Campylobacter mucosalis]|uniref:RNA methyltransferase, RsmD family n=1 Tax=Campylobacter mucosalis CCUG 21559 TaxID=1032067 RepID=A0A6G5QHA6_9BACT|nr:16S rRNA (guanine(966)-N(2))-methyltransferase RsmD [Campylobacter mucosalis]KEA46512.1 methyltransferase [Campylobacter mucosalis]QCD45075.1 RNA methyltransferase, RsmD family [Campylobacter mucosalis CCUG 21559]QKF62990.1 RNA methyltransferase, RsmD family [Campylobacter mucosalis]
MKLFTTISSGIYKGKKLELPSLSTTRSTKSIVKGSFFNTIRDELRGLVFIEGFGGSGVMACEAVSNGAKSSIAIEIDKNAFKLTQNNLKSLNAQNLEAINGDSFEILPKIITNKDEQFIIYLDPPFDFRDGFSGVYDKLIKMVENLDFKKIKMVVFEHSSDFKMPENFSNFRLLKTKKFGATSLSYFV